jgi:hypothetical protein
MVLKFVATIILDDMGVAESMRHLCAINSVQISLVLKIVSVPFEDFIVQQS